jgi:hypothetical protein
MFVAIGIISILIAVFFFVVTAINQANATRFMYSGQEVKAQIEDLNWKGVPKSLYITYKYTDAFGTERHAKDQYPFADNAAELKVGQQIDILYLMNFPEQTRIARKQAILMSRVQESPWMNIAAIAVLGLLCIAIGL